MKRKSATLVAMDGAGSSLLAYLALRFTYLGSGEWREQLREGRLRVNGAVSAEDRILASGDLVDFDASGIVEPEVDGRIGIVYEDADFLIADKGGSLPCHPGGRFFEHSLWFILRERYGSVHIATRLDRETSGLVLVCRKPAAAAFAASALARGVMEKSYVAMVHGSFPERLEARGFLVKDRSSLIRKKRRLVLEPGPGEDAEACATSFELISRCAHRAGEISMLHARPATGRTHQIRASLFSLGFPLVGDKLYGLDEGFFLRFAAGRLDEEDRERLILPCQALHCASLGFESPSGQRIQATSEPRWAPLWPASLPQLPVRR
jgi:RluA family pseudouridine synthase